MNECKPLAEGEYDLPRTWNRDLWNTKVKTEAGGVLIPINRPTLNLDYPPPPLPPAIAGGT